ncbi:IPTL-CTERM sorting domain-containing protein [Acidovorax sp. NPDC077693]|uniref:IPTL-CTERM sorting domain-containing protein n=1 Tax=unclassified Acidovorax TaxID=2684926 RepID=UPI0037C5797E
MQAGRRWSVTGKFAVAASLCCAASVAWPATIAATVTRAGGDWTLTWTGIGCDFVDFFNTTGAPHVWSLTVDGTTAVAPLGTVTFIGGPPDDGTLDLTGPNGVLSRVTIDGATSFVCGPDLLTLPGYIAVPPGAKSIPTLSEWALVLMAGLVGVVGIARFRRGGRQAGRRA